MKSAPMWTMRVALFVALLIAALLVLIVIGHQELCGPGRVLFVPQC